MIDKEHPVIRALVEKGYKLSLHAFLCGNRTSIQYCAAQKPKQSLYGRSPAGDLDEALHNLALSAGLDDGSEARTSDVSSDDSPHAA